MIADIIVDLQYGDCGKGKVAHYLAKSRSYTHVLRYNGGSNAGHTIFHKNKKFVTHQVPAGVFFGVRSIIGPGCVIDPESLLKEVGMLERAGIPARRLLRVAGNAHIVTAAHKAEENSEWGDYPFVTSSHATVAGALLNGIPPQAVREVWGVAKLYETYVGAKRFEPRDPVFTKLRALGEEYGATTGRPRQCNWLDLDLLERAVRMNGVTHLVFNKVDILRALGVWKVLSKNGVRNFANENSIKKFLLDRLQSWRLAKKNIYFSERKDRI